MRVISHSSPHFLVANSRIYILIHGRGCLLQIQRAFPMCENTILLQLSTFYQAVVCTHTEGLVAQLLVEFVVYFTMAWARHQIWMHPHFELTNGIQDKLFKRHSSVKPNARQHLKHTEQNKLKNTCRLTCWSKHTRSAYLDSTRSVLNLQSQRSLLSRLCLDTMADCVSSAASAS